jgi:hypothetical protein
MPLMRHMHQGACITGRSIPALHTDDIQHRNIIKIRRSQVFALRHAPRQPLQQAPHTAHCTRTYIPSTGESYWTTTGASREQERGAQLSRQVTPQMNQLETLRMTALKSCGFLNAPAHAGALGMYTISDLMHTAPQLSHHHASGYPDAQLRGAFYHDALPRHAVELCTNDAHAHSFIIHNSSSSSSSTTKNIAASSTNHNMCSKGDKFMSSSTDLSRDSTSSAAGQETESKFLSTLYNDSKSADDFYSDMPSDMPSDLPGSFSRDVSTNLLAFDWDAPPPLSGSTSRTTSFTFAALGDATAVSQHECCAPPLKKARV